MFSQMGSKPTATLHYKVQHTHDFSLVFIQSARRGSSLAEHRAPVFREREGSLTTHPACGTRSPMPLGASQSWAPRAIRDPLAKCSKPEST